MRRTKIPAKIVVILRFVNTPIRSLFRVNHQRGTRERKPEAESYLAVYEDYKQIQSKRIAMVVGMVLTNLVTRRLIYGLIFFFPSIPSTIAWPANVPSCG